MSHDASHYRVTPPIMVWPLAPGRLRSDLRTRFGPGASGTRVLFTDMSHSKLDEIPAVASLCDVLKELSRQSGGRPIALVYDGERGFFCGPAGIAEHSDQPPEVSPSATPYLATAPADWWRDSVAGAIAACSAVHFVPGSLVGLLWKKPAKL